MNDVEKQKQLRLNENAFAKLKKLILRPTKENMNDEHTNTILILQMAINFQV